MNKRETISSFIDNDANMSNCAYIRVCACEKDKIAGFCVTYRKLFTNISKVARRPGNYDLKLIKDIIDKA